MKAAGLRRRVSFPTAPSLPTFKREDARRFRVAGQDLSCPVCGTDAFWSRTVLMNTALLTALGADMLNREAYLLVCRLCSHVLWFHDDAVVRPQD